MSATVQQALAAELINDVEINALVSGRVYDTVAPPNAIMPYIILQQLTSDHHYHMGGRSGMAVTDIQVTIWDNTPPWALSDTLRKLLTNKFNTLGAGSYTITTYDNIVESVSEDYEPPGFGDEVGAFAVRMIARIWHYESLRD